MSTHYDYQNEIGNTHATFRNYRDKRWNQYFHKTYRHIVANMLGAVPANSTVLDIGTSHGHWFPFFQQLKFAKILGVEFDPVRANLAKENGYDMVYNCDAANIPLPDDSVDMAVSNDVFVHVLRIEDKLAILREARRILKPGGILIFNHTMAPAYAGSHYYVDDYCSYLNLHEFLDLTIQAGYKIVDVKPTYYNFRHSNPDVITKIFRKLMVLPIPLIPHILFGLNSLHSRTLTLEQSDVVYIKAVA